MASENDQSKLESNDVATGFAKYSKDIVASIVVFLVALPLCMGIALASGAPPMAGIVTGIVGGIVVGLFSGAPLQVSGPAAGLAVMCAELLREFRTPEGDPDMMMLGSVVLIAGLVQLGAGLLRMGQWFRAVSPADIHGMLAGIGVLIFTSQFHVMIDDDPKENAIQNIVTLPSAIEKSIGPLDEPVTGPLDASAKHHWAARIGIWTIITMILWKVIAPKWLQIIPAPLVGVILAMAEAYSLSLPIKFVQVSNLMEGIHLITPEVARHAVSWTILGAGVSMAFIASAETLLCATAVDKMHQGPRTKYDRELAAQGLGNSICGLLGVLPMTGVIVRSAANVDAGARTRLSAILHGVLLLVFVALFPNILGLIPQASLGAILVYTGYKLMNPAAVRKLWQKGIGEENIYAATDNMHDATDLLTGVLDGIGLSAAKLLYTFSRLDIRLEFSPDKRRTEMHLDGTATFIRLPKLADALEQVPGNTELHVRFDHLNYIDHACLDLLISWEKQHKTTGGSLVLDWEGLTARFRQPSMNSKNPQAYEETVELPPAENGSDGQSAGNDSAEAQSDESSAVADSEKTQ